MFDSRDFLFPSSSYSSFFFLFFFFKFLHALSFENNQWHIFFFFFPKKNLTNDCLRYGILGDVYSRGGPVDFLTANVIQSLERSQSVVSHFQR